MTQYIAKEGDRDKRMDLVLMDLLPTLTRSTVKRVIIEGFAKAKRKGASEFEQVMPNFRMREGDEILVNNDLVDKYVNKGGDLINEIKPKNLDLEVLYEDENLLVVNKPSGVHSHPVLKHDNNSMLSGLYYHVQHQDKFNKDVKVRLLHRLDSETSGVLLSVKTLNAQDYYSKLFEKRDLRKEYYAIVHGDFEGFLKHHRKSEFTITTYIAKSPDGDKNQVNTTKKRGKIAKSTIYFEKHFNKFGKRKFSVVRVVPETGRTHQIRVHLSSLGFPILGDTLYGGQKYRRIMLHAYQITLPMYKTKEVKTFRAELPDLFIE